jgi:EpsI family protein
MNPLRFWSAALLLAATALLLHSRPGVDRNPPSTPVSELPIVIDGWTGRDQPIDQETLDVLGAGQYLSRNYARDRRTPPIDLFLAYLPTQRTGQTIHSPRHCLPGGGWSFESSSYQDLTDAGGKLHRVGEYVIADGASRQIVIYWYQAHGRSVANEYIAKFYMVADAIRTNRTDGALVRVVTPIAANETEQASRARAEAFAMQLAPLLPRFIPD